VDVNFFLKQRTAFIRAFYDEGVAPFLETQRRIDQGEPPFDEPPYSEDPEPPYLAEWIDAATGVDVLSQACVSLLSDTLKLYFNTLQQRTIGFSFDKGEKAVLKKGFVAAYKAALGQVYGTDWSDCPARFDVIEQVVLARNLSQHGSQLTSFHLSHDAKTLRDYSQPLFASPAEWKAWVENGGGEASFLMPAVKITREALFEAIDEIEGLADWLDTHAGGIDAWRQSQAGETPDSEAEVFGLLSAARSALDLRGQALALFEERRPEVIDQGDAKGLVIDGRRLERSTNGPLSARGLIGAQAFLANLVVVENCITKLAGLRGLPPHIKANAGRSLKAIKAVVDRQVRNTAEHIDDRVVARADQSLISSSIFEPDLLCSTRADGAIGAVAISQATLDTVAMALDTVVWTPEQIATMARPRSRPRR
jgi:hypothetical protein